MDIPYCSQDLHSGQVRCTALLMMMITPMLLLLPSNFNYNS